MLSGDDPPPVDHPSKAQSVFQHSVDLYNFSTLLNSCTLRDQARVRGISHHPSASAWLRAIPSESLGLTLSGGEFVTALRYWLGIPLFPASVRCSCGTVIDSFGDHILGCGNGPLRIRRHDAICDVIWHALLQDHSGCKKEQRCSTDLDRPGDVFHPDFEFGKPAYFDVSVHHPLQDSLICLSAATAGVAAGRGEADKDSHHEASVRAAGGIFIPLVVESLGLWSPHSLAILRVIALRTTSKSGASTALAFCHFIEQLSMCLWRYNSQMLLHHLSLLPGSPLWELGG